MIKILKIFSLFIGVFFLFAILFFSFAPEPRTNAVIEGWRRVNRNPGQVCLDYTREKLKDPSSIRLTEWHEDKDNDGFVILRYKATNSYGAYVDGTQKCYVRGESVDNVTTRAQEIVEDLKRKNAESTQKTKTGEIISCKVKEVITSGNYTYLLVLNGTGDKVWLATPKAIVNIGDSIEYPDTKPLRNFQVKTLNRTFDKLFFVSGVKVLNNR